MSETNPEVQKVAGSMKVLGIVTMIFGFLAIAMPWMASESVILLIGFLVMAGGITRMFWAFKAGSLGKGILVFLIGVLTLLAGIAVVSHPILSLAILTIFLAVYFLIDGISELIAAFGLPSGQGGRGWLMFDGVVTVLLGVFMFTGFPLTGILAIGILLGIKLLFAGMTMLTLGSVVKIKTAP